VCWADWIKLKVASRMKGERGFDRIELKRRMDQSNRCQTREERPLDVEEQREKWDDNGKLG
ncbi:unnamed protein product, partial [Dovyalis caffra]